MLWFLAGPRKKQKVERASDPLNSNDVAVFERNIIRNGLRGRVGSFIVLVILREEHNM